MAVIAPRGGLGHDVPAPRGPTDRRPQLVLLALIALSTALAVVIAVKTPAWESADEPDHVENIETLVGGHWYTMSTDCLAFDKTAFGVQGKYAHCSGTEAHQPPLYYLLTAGVQTLEGHPPFHVSPGSETFFTQHGLFVHHSAADHGPCYG
jgi:hypothetical protein